MLEVPSLGREDPFLNKVTHPENVSLALTSYPLHEKTVNLKNGAEWEM